MKTKAKSKQHVQDMNSSKIIGNSNIKSVLLCFVITVVTFFVYSGSFDNDFVNWDDQVYVLSLIHI